MADVPFNPTYGSGQVVAAAAASAAISNLNGNDKQVVVTNLGANVAYVRVVSDTSAATTADYPVPAGQQVNLTKGDGTRLAYISAAGTSLHIITGNGW